MRTANCNCNAAAMVSTADSDEAYVVALCDKVLGFEASRQHRFDWLLGDPGSSGRKVRLPVDAYWPEFGLVVEYRERQHDKPVAHFDKPDRLTVSGVHRGEQRRLYDQRREQLIPMHGLRLVVVRPDDLSADSRGRLRRLPDHDLLMLQSLLSLDPPSWWVMVASRDARMPSCCGRIELVKRPIPPCRRAPVRCEFLIVQPRSSMTRT